MTLQEFDRKKCEEIRMQRVREMWAERDEYLRAKRIVMEYERKYGETYDTI